MNDRAMRIYRGELDGEMPSAEELRAWVNRCPKGWLLDIFRTCVHRMALEAVFAYPRHIVERAETMVEAAINPDSKRPELQ